jgi:hypothetical protein
MVRGPSTSLRMPPWESGLRRGPKALAGNYVFLKML